MCFQTASYHKAIEEITNIAPHMDGQSFFKWIVGQHENVIISLCIYQEGKLADEWLLISLVNVSVHILSERMPAI